LSRICATVAWCLRDAFGFKGWTGKGPGRNCRESSAISRGKSSCLANLTLVASVCDRHHAHGLGLSGEHSRAVREYRERFAHDQQCRLRQSDATHQGLWRVAADVWAAIQGPYVKLGEISKFIEPDTFLDASFVEAANDRTLDEVKAGLAKWKAEHPDRMIN
jgi:hypothetical protein